MSPGGEGERGGPVTVAVTRVVKPGREREFEDALHDFVSGTLAGETLSVHVLRPAPGDDSRRYGILRRFPDAQARDAFYASEAFRAWERRVAPLVEGERRVEEASGLEAWFTSPGRAIVPPPRLKMAIVTLVGVYPLSLALPWLLRPLVGGWPRALSALVVGACMVAALTWLVMPRLAKLFRRWLHPAAGGAS